MAVSGSKLIPIACIALCVLAVLCGIIVLGSIKDKVKDSHVASIPLTNKSRQVKMHNVKATYCWFNPAVSETPCEFGVALGAFAMIFGSLMLTLSVVEFMKPSLVPGTIDALSVKPPSPEDILSVPWYRVMLMARVVLSAIMAFLFLVAFGVMAKEWEDNNQKAFMTTSTIGAVQGALAFCFISLLSWVALAVLYGLRYRCYTVEATYLHGTNSLEENSSNCTAEIHFTADDEQNFAGQEQAHLHAMTQAEVIYTNA